MKAGFRGILALGLGLAWFMWGAPAADRWIGQEEINRDPALSATDLRRMLQTLPPRQRPGPARRRALEARLGEAESAWSLESSWGARVSGVLNTAQRQQASELEPGFQAPPRSTDLKVDPALLSLAQALLDRYAWADVPIPEVPTTDPWGGYEAGKRLRGIHALVDRGALQPQQAHAILAATLLALQSQERRMDREEEATVLLKQADGT